MLGLLLIAQLSIDWRAPVDCPPTAAITAEIVRLTGGDTAAATVAATATVTPPGADPRWTARLELSSPRGGSTREIAGGSCDELARALALILAVAISDDVDDAAPTPAAAEEVTAPGGPLEGASTTTLAPARALAAPAERSGGDVSIAVAVLGDVGSLPNLGAAGEVSMGLGLAEHVELRAALRAWLGQRRVIREVPEAGSDVGLWAGQLLGCARARPYGAVCAGAEVGVLSGEGFGVTTPRDASTAWVAIVGSARATWPLADRWSLAAQLEVAVPAVQPVFVLGRVGEVHRAPTASFRWSVGVDVSIP